MFSRTVTMTLTEFLNQSKAPTIQDDLNQFQQHMNNFNNIYNDIQKDLQYQNYILDNTLQQIQQAKSGITITPDIPVTPQVTPAKFDFFNKLIPDNNSGFMESIKEIIEPLKTIAKFLDYIMHPGKILFFILNWTIEWSYFLCLIVALAAFILYILGDKGKLKYIPISITVYILLQAIGVIIK